MLKILEREQRNAQQGEAFFFLSDKKSRLLLDQHFNKEDNTTVPIKPTVSILEAIHQSPLGKLLLPKAQIHLPVRAQTTPD